MLTEDDKRMLTELLGECSHEEDEEKTKTYICDPRHRNVWAICKKCEFTYTRSQATRTFTTWQDTGDLKRKIVEMGEWDEFIDFTLEEHGSLGPVFSNEAKFYKADYIDWLMNPERFCELVAKWWKERRKG